MFVIWVNFTITNVVKSSPYEIIVWAEQCASRFGFFILLFKRLHLFESDFFFVPKYPHIPIFK